MDRALAVTTVDNPYDPFTEFDDWYRLDMLYGYNTCGWLASLTTSHTEASEFDQKDSIEFAIDQMVELFPETFVKLHGPMKVGA